NAGYILGARLLALGPMPDLALGELAGLLLAPLLRGMMQALGLFLGGLAGWSVRIRLARIERCRMGRNRGRLSKWFSRVLFRRVWRALRLHRLRHSRLYLFDLRHLVLSPENPLDALPERQCPERFALIHAAFQRHDALLAHAVVVR